MELETDPGSEVPLAWFHVSQLMEKITSID